MARPVEELKSPSKTEIGPGRFSLGVCLGPWTILTRSLVPVTGSQPTYRQIRPTRQDLRWANKTRDGLARPRMARKDQRLLHKTRDGRTRPEMARQDQSLPTRPEIARQDQRLPTRPEMARQDQRWPYKTKDGPTRVVPRVPRDL